MPEHRYTPTAGMLRALADARGATPLDYMRCRLRGLTDVNHMPTDAGRVVIRTEITRREGWSHQFDHLQGAQFDILYRGARRG
jgi:hypothetical protein